MSLITISCYSQIKGTVKGIDSHTGVLKEEELAGANVYWANTTTGVSTDNKGILI